MTVSLGNHRQREKILHDAQHGNLTHALLLSGPSGIGKFAFLQSLVPVLLDGSPALPPALVSVDRLYMDGVDSDMETLAKVSTFNQSHRKRLRKKTDTIGVDDLEAFTHQLHSTVDSPYKILLVRDVERMTRETANKFLKILEEPPAKTLFLLTTSSEAKLLSTIISRVRREHFSLTPDTQIKEYIQAEGADFSTEDQKSLLFLAEGKSAFLLDMMASKDLFDAEKEKASKIAEIVTASKIGKMNLAQEYAKRPVSEIISFLRGLQRLFREQLSTSTRANNLHEIEKRVKALDAMQSAIAALGRNGNKRMVLEEAFFAL